MICHLEDHMAGHQRGSHHDCVSDEQESYFLQGIEHVSLLLVEHKMSGQSIY